MGPHVCLKHRLSQMGKAFFYVQALWMKKVLLYIFINVVQMTISVEYSEYEMHL